MVENLQKDEATLQDMLEMSASIHHPHQVGLCVCARVSGVCMCVRVHTPSPAGVSVQCACMYMICVNWCIEALMKIE